MKLAISNLAWEPHENEKVARILVKNKIHSLEIAPTKISSNSLLLSLEQLKSHARFWTKFNIQWVAMQSLLYGRPDLQVFGQGAKATLNYLKSMIQLAHSLGIQRLILGAAKNRLKDPDQSIKENLAHATLFFRQLGQFAYQHKVVFCIEPNPPQYGCNFVTCSEEAIKLINGVNSKGFGLHLDTAALFLAKENAIETIKKNVNILKHIHFSAPNLRPIDPDSIEIPYIEIIKVLKKSNYKDYISIEMVGQPEERNTTIIDSITKKLTIFF